ncbi:MAG TPA: hypothetical protein VGG13_03210 [Candidatus Saccharimonadales bacterium]
MHEQQAVGQAVREVMSAQRLAGEGSGQHAYTPRSANDAPRLQGGPRPSALSHDELVAAPAASGAAGQPTAKPAVKSNPNSTQNTLQIAEVRDGLVIMSDGTFRSVVMAKSINFDLMSPQEQEAVEYSYQGFLNSLYFPVQIFIRSQKVDLQPYIAKLDKIRSEHDNMLLAMLMEDYIEYISGLSEETNIMDKKFYVVIPFSTVESDKQQSLTSSKSFISGFAEMLSNKPSHIVVNETTLEKAKTELRNRVQATLSGLMQCGVKGLPLDTQELIELYYDMYNPDTATNQHLKNFNDLTADIITKGEGHAPQAHLEGELQ